MLTDVEHHIQAMRKSGHPDKDIARYLDVSEAVVASIPPPPAEHRCKCGCRLLGDETVCLACRVKPKLR